MCVSKAGEQKKSDVPDVSVIMAAHNTGAYIEAALRSMMDQTLREIEIIVVDDASTDETPQVLARLVAEDPRLRVLRQDRNIGPAVARNLAIEAARAPCIAVMDSDDLSMPHRLEVQKAYLDAHPEVIMVAASNRRIDAQGRVVSAQRRTLSPLELRWRLRFGMPLVHPSVMFRKHDARGDVLRYDPAFPVAQDFDLVTRAAEKGDITSLADVLVDWRLHGTSITATKLARQKEAAEVCTTRVQMRDLTEAQRRDLVPFMEIVLGKRPATIFGAIRSIRAMARLLAADARAHPAQAGALRRQAISLLNYHIGVLGIGMARFGMLLLLLSPRLFLAALDERRHRRAWRRQYVPA